MTFWRKKCICPSEADLRNTSIVVLAGNCARHGHYSYGPDDLRSLREPTISLVDDTIVALDKELS
jgi:hypothetical protein